MPATIELVGDDAAIKLVPEEGGEPTRTYPADVEAVEGNVASLQADKADAADLTAHTSDLDNPHETNAAQVGADPAGTAAAAVADHEAAADPHPQYMTEAEVDSGYAALVHTHAQADVTNLVTDLAAKAPLATVVTESTTARTLVLSDAGAYIRLTHASGCTVTVPPQSSVAWTANAEIAFRVAGAGAPTVTEGSGVTVNNRAAAGGMSQHMTFALKRIGSDLWDLV